MSAIEIFQYQNTPVTFKTDNGEVFINLTEMAKPFGKLPADFLRLDQTKQFIDAFKERCSIGFPIVNTVKGNYSCDMGNPISQGTWAHQKLALKFAAWLNPKFELWVYDRIEELMKSGYTKLDSISRKDLAKMLFEAEEEKERIQLESRESQKALTEAAPKILFADSVATSDKSILIAELAKILKQNGIDIGQNRLFEWLRKNNYLCSKGEYYNQPTQRAMELELFELKKTTINQPGGTILICVTPKVTGKGQLYFVNKFLTAA